MSDTVINPEITAKLAECDEIHALGDPGNWMRMYGPIPAIRLFESYPTLRQHIAAQAAQNAVLRKALERIYEGCARTLSEPADSRDDQHCIQHSANVAEESLAATPAASLASVKAGALRDLLPKLAPFTKFNEGWYCDGIKDAIGTIRDAAKELEAAAKGEKDAATR